MAGIGGFRGVSASQDARFVNKQKRMLRTKKFPKELEVAVDYSRVFWPVIREWTAKRVTELLGVEDEVLIQFIHNRLENTKELNPKELYLDLMPFLEKNAGLFMKELWTLLASASNSTTGIPQQIMDAKAEEVKKHKERQELYLQTIEQERKKVLAIQEGAKKSEKPQDNEEDVEREEEKKSHGEDLKEGKEHHRSGKEKKKRWNPRHHSPTRRKEEMVHRRRHRSSSLERRPSRLPLHHSSHRAKEIDSRRKYGKERRVVRTPLDPRSVSRSPPISRHGSPPPRNSNLPLARKREPHDKKSRSPSRRDRRRNERTEVTPATKSPSPRSHNRMSSTPDPREDTPSPPSDRDSKTPTPTPATPQTFTPPTRLEDEPAKWLSRTAPSLHPRDRGQKSTSDKWITKQDTYGGGGGGLSSRSYRFEGTHRPSSYRYDAPQVRRGYEERRHRKDYDSSRYPPSYHRSHRYYDHEPKQLDRSRRGYAYRPVSPIRLPSHEGRDSYHRERRSASSSSFDEVERSKWDSSSESGDSRKREVRRRNEGKERSKTSRKRDKHISKKTKKLRQEKNVDSDLGEQFSSQDSEPESKTKEKMKKKLSEILEKKDSLRLE